MSSESESARPTARKGKNAKVRHVPVIGSAEPVTPDETVILRIVAMAFLLIGFALLWGGSSTGRLVGGALIVLSVAGYFGAMALARDRDWRIAEGLSPGIFSVENAFTVLSLAAFLTLFWMNLKSESLAERLLGAAGLLFIGWLISYAIVNAIRRRRKVSNEQ